MSVEDSSTLALGITLGTLGSIFINTGNNVQSLGMARLYRAREADIANGVVIARGKNGKEVDINTCASPIWICGTVVFVTGSLLNFTAFAFAPQSILASLEGIQFVTNVCFGRWVLGSNVTKLMCLGTVIVIAGVVITVLSASVVGTLEADVDDLLELWQNPLWSGYLVFCGATGLALHIIHQAYNKAATEVAANTRSQGLPYADYVLPVTYATFSALFGTIAVVMAKVLSELVTLWITGTDIFFGGDAWFTWATLAAWIAFVAVWLFRMNEALSLYDPLFIIPLLQVNFILFAIISGGIFFKEFDYFQTINVIGFCCGVAMLLGGIFLLSPEMAAPPKVAPAPPSPIKRSFSFSATNGGRSAGGAASPPTVQAQPDSSASSSSPASGNRGAGEDEESGPASESSSKSAGQGRGSFTMRGSARVAPENASADDADCTVPPGALEKEPSLTAECFTSADGRREIYRL